MASSHPAPPETLEAPLELDPGDWNPRDVYFLLTSLVIPRPIAWVSTVSPDGVRNLAPYSYFNIVAADPPHVMFSSAGVKDSLRNLRASGEFVLNVVAVDLVEPMNFSSTDFPSEHDEFTWSGLTPLPSLRVAPPRVGEARAHLECRVVQEVAVGRSYVVIGEVVHVHVDPTVWRAGRVDPGLLAPVARLAGALYAELGECFALPRPAWKDLSANAHGADAIPRRKPRAGG